MKRKQTLQLLFSLFFFFLSLFFPSISHSIDLSDETNLSQEGLLQDVPSSEKGTESQNPIDIELFQDYPDATPEFEWYDLEREAPPELEVFFEPYRLKIGDTLLISVYGEPGTQRSVMVNPTGTIIYPFVDEVFVLGNTIDQVRFKLEERLKEHFRFGIVSLTPTSFVGDYYTILGEVRAPGTRPYNAASSVLSAIAEAGGIRTRLFRDETIDMADLTRSFLARDGSYIPLDFTKLIEEGDMSEDIPLLPGDFIYIPSYQDKSIFIFGEVGQPQRLDFIETMTLMEALSFAGGVTQRASSRAVVIRGALSCPLRYLIDINLIFKGYACDFELQPGDILFVPARQFTNLREIVINALNTWVSIVSARAAGATFTSIVPADTDPLIPIPFLDPSAGLQQSGGFGGGFAEF